jgi:hypothetical protein
LLQLLLCDEYQDEKKMTNFLQWCDNQLRDRSDLVVVAAGWKWSDLREESPDDEMPVRQ